MSFIKCPNCGRDIHEKTDVCPFCGWIFDSGLEALLKLRSEEVVEKKRDLLIDIDYNKNIPRKEKYLLFLMGTIFVVMLCLICAMVWYFNIM